MRAALYIGRFPGEGFEEEVATARAFCARHGLLPVMLHHSDFLQNKRKVEAFLASARRGEFEVLVGPSPESFSTRFLNNLVDAGVGVACYKG